MRSVNATILAKLASSEFRPFYLLDMEIDSTHYRYTDCDVPLVYDANIYTPRPFSRGSAQYSMSAIVDTMDITLTNLDEAMTALFVGGTPQGEPTTLLKVLVDDDGLIIGQPWGLVAAYDFDEGAGTTLTDRSGNGNDGTIYGTHAWVAGKSGTCLDFDGTGGYVRVTDLILTSATEVSLSFWLNIDVQGSNYCRCFSDNGGMRVYFSSGNGTNGLFGSIGNDVNGWLMFNPDLTGQVWNHIVLTANASDGKIKSYLNGSFVSERSAGFTTITLNDMFIGVDYLGSHALTGMIDEVRIYNRALSQAEISHIYNNPGEDMADGAVTEFEGTIDSWDPDEEDIRITLSSPMMQWTQKTQAVQSALCRWKIFKGTECAYAGDQSWCDRTYSRCSALANTANFGGERFLPSIINKDIWWGAIPKG